MYLLTTKAAIQFAQETKQSPFTRSLPSNLSQLPNFLLDEDDESSRIFVYLLDRKFLYGLTRGLNTELLIAKARFMGQGENPELLEDFHPIENSKIRVILRDPNQDLIDNIIQGLDDSYQLNPATDLTEAIHNRLS